jgi:hypothetical protein
MTRSLLVPLIILAAVLSTSQAAVASIFGIGVPEQDDWSDMAFPTGVSGSFASGTKLLTIAASPSNDLEIGSDFGPSNPGRHYGTAGTLGNAFSATLNVRGVVVEPDGSITNGGSVPVTFNGSVPGSIGDDYGIVAGAPLLLGTVLDVLLDAMGDNTLDILFSISGGALQNINPALGTNFARSSFSAPSLVGSAALDGLLGNHEH